MSEDDPKAANKIRNIWYGENFTKCDGNILDFSNMTSIILTSAVRADASTSFFEIVSGGFDQLTRKVDYTFQFVYRKESIAYYYLKEILFAMMMTLAFTFFVNERYRKLFRAPLKYVGLDKNGNQIFTESSSMYDFD